MDCYRVEFNKVRNHFQTLEAAVRYVKALTGELEAGTLVFILKAEGLDPYEDPNLVNEFELISTINVVWEQAHKQEPPKQKYKPQKPSPPIKTKLELSFDILGIVPVSDKAMVKSRFKKLAKEYHPDVGGDGAMFVAVSEAYQYILTSKGWK